MSVAGSSPGSPAIACLAFLLYVRQIFQQVSGQTAISSTDRLPLDTFAGYSIFGAGLTTG